MTSISTGTIVRFFLVGIFLFTLYYLLDVVLVILAAVVIASALEPIIRRLKLVGFHRIVAAITLYLLVALILSGILIFFIPTVVSEAISFLNNIPKSISLQELWSPFGNIDMAGSSLGEKVVSLRDLVTGLQGFLPGSGTGVFETAFSIFGGVLSFILIVVLSFYLSVQEEGVDNFLRIVTPVRHYAYILNLWKRAQRKIGFWLQGQIVLGLIVGLLVYFVLLLVGIPHALLLALLAALLEIIPVFGPIIAAVPAGLIAFSSAGLGTAVLVLVLYLIIQQFENQVFYPLVVKKIVGMSPIVVILALVVGAKLAGVLGALVAVPLSAAFMEYVSDIEKYKRAEIAEREVVKKGDAV